MATWQYAKPACAARLAAQPHIAAGSSLQSRLPRSLVSQSRVPVISRTLVAELRQSLRTDALDFQKLVDVVEPSYLRSIVEDALRGDRSDAFEGLQFA